MPRHCSPLAWMREVCSIFMEFMADDSCTYANDDETVREEQQADS